MIGAPRMLIALYDYNAREISDMSFRKGDRMELLDDRYASSFLVMICKHCVLILTLIYILPVILIGGKPNILPLTKWDMFRETLLHWNNQWRATSNLNI